MSIFKYVLLSYVGCVNRPFCVGVGGWGSGLRGTLRLRKVSEHWDGVKVIGREKMTKN